MDVKILKEKLAGIEESYRETFQTMSDHLFHHPELSGEEYDSAKYLAQVMESFDFTVRFPYPDTQELETAFIAEFGTGDGPTIAFLAEYDALPGYNTPSGNGHACGHNWIASTMCGSAIVLSKLQEHFDGRILLIGTPAEETYGGKINMLKEGAFEGVDIVFQAHLANETVIDSAALAMTDYEFEFIGKAAHAASYPENGINALDAVQLTFMGINALRQHVRQDVRIHGIVKEGGTATNITPDRGICHITVRSQDREYLKHVSSRVIECGRGAGIMTGAEFTYRQLGNSFDDLLNVPSLMELTKMNFVDVGITHFTSQKDAPTPGSTDIGNVSYNCPTLYVEVDLEADKPFFVHEEEALRYVNSHYAYVKMSQVIRAFSASALELYLDPVRLEAIKREHRQIREKK
ncbi:amidohydrolase [Sporosarcina gallistercoris]|uniref:Peptidase M20 domain-containing protein 2 n=1 Tax=Sporosarcina gallistercoris TaxID=2762245 RepID=A0ABR8PK95_9BACL|nr:amidohydrolase [Sporosarcina gallistercoris]MBD7908499.1 amidohydrolase [Sporosarcina gallistercoris]